MNAPSRHRWLSLSRIVLRVIAVAAILFVTTCVVGGRASAQVNLLPQGNFQRPGVNTGWAEGFNIPNNQEFQVISDHGKHWLRIENRDAGRLADSPWQAFGFPGPRRRPAVGSL